MHTRPKILMFCLDLKRYNKHCSSVAAYYMNFLTVLKKLMFCLDHNRDNKNCSSVAAYYNCFDVLSMNFLVHAYFTDVMSSSNAR